MWNDKFFNDYFTLNGSLDVYLPAPLPPLEFLADCRVAYLKSLQLIIVSFTC